jgi:protein phosphatase
MSKKDGLFKDNQGGLRMLKTLYAGLSNVGRVRTSNEDSMGLFPDLNLFLVADGMGGHAAGEVASSMAVETVRDSIAKNEGTRDHPLAAGRLETAIKVSNQKIYQAGRQTPALAGMGTTIISVLLDQDTAYIGYVGDSRAYLARDNEIAQLTTDHSLVNEYLKKGMMSPEEAERHPLKHVLSRALGTAPEVEVDLISLPLKTEDMLLLCSDGLSNTVTQQIMLQILKRSRGNLQEACNQLIDQANNRGGVDNITVIVLQCTSTPLNPE